MYLSQIGVRLVSVAMFMMALCFVWTGFSFSHMWWHGRLLYAAIPWLTGAGGEPKVHRQRGDRAAKPSRSRRQHKYDSPQVVSRVGLDVGILG